MSKYLKIILSLPKTFFFNVRMFGFKVGIKMPIFVSYDVKIKTKRGGISLPQNLGTWKIKIGFHSGSYGIEKMAKGGVISISPMGRLVFKGPANFTPGITIRVSEMGKIIFGSNFSCNRNCCLTCNKSIEFGDDALLGWNVQIRTSDGHPIYLTEDIDRKILLNEAKSVKIGKNVWLAANVDVLKGTRIPDGCVVGYRSCVTKEFSEKNTIIAGYPAKVIKHGINWNKD